MLDMQTESTNGQCASFVDARDGDVVLTLRGYGVAFGERVVLSSIDLEVPSKGAFVLLGPGGTGKSTLLRTLAGFNANNPSLRTWGEAVYAGHALESQSTMLPSLVSQSARLMIASLLENLMNDFPQRHRYTPKQQRDLGVDLLEQAGLGDYVKKIDEPVVKLPLGIQRQVAMVRLAAANPPLLFADEPTTGISESEADTLLAFIAQEAEKRSMFIVLHNQEQASRLGGQVSLMAGGCIQESLPSSAFFTSPSTPAAQEFIRNGNCAVPAPGAEPETLDEEAPQAAPLPEPARRYVRAASGPRGFLWLRNGVLAGTPRPGIVVDLDEDLEALRRVGVTTLISLTQTPMDSSALARVGISHLSSPIPDMAAPGVEQAIELCQQIEAMIREKEVIAVHCRAGLGRTGTILAACLIWEGHTALDALERARRVNPNWVQSEEQARFLEEFARVVANRASSEKKAVSRKSLRRKS